MGAEVAERESGRKDSDAGCSLRLGSCKNPNISDSFIFACKFRLAIKTLKKILAILAILKRMTLKAN